jgi:hypothetical protein
MKNGLDCMKGGPISEVGRVQRFLPGTRKAIETRERLSFRGYSNVFVGKEPQELSQKLATRHPQGHKESGDETKVFKHGSRTSKLRQAVEEASRFQPLQRILPAHH